MASNSLRFRKVAALPTTGTMTVGDVYFVAGKGLYVATTTAVSGLVRIANDYEVTISDSVSSTSSTSAASSKAVKSAYDLASSAKSAAESAQTTADSKESSATAVRHTASTAAGSATKPVYVAADGTATACTYSLGKDVPSDAVFTDTHNSHGHTFTANTATSTASTDTSVAVVSSIGNATATTGNLSSTYDKVSVPTLKVTNSLATRISSLETANTTGMQYKGTATAVPSSGKVGDVYKVTTAISSLGAEVGDFIVCKTATDGSTAATWDVWQANVTKDAYWDTNTPTDGNFVYADGTTGKLKDSGKNASSFAAASHNQASSTITTLGGYSKGTSSAALATTDTLNAALGKLEVRVGNAQTTADGKESSATAVRHTASTAVGSATTPVYVAADGTATACTYSLAKSVPSDAVFTDTHHTYSFTINDGQATPVAAQTFSQNAAKTLAIKASASGNLTASTSSASANSGTLTVNVGVASGYAIPTTTQITSWDGKWTASDATYDAKGIAKFDTNAFVVSSGSVSLGWAEFA